MDKRKRQKQNNININNTRKKLRFNSCNLSKNSFTHFENLDNALIYEIFDYLDFYDTYQAFSNLNLRFDNILNHSSFPIRINLLFISKSFFNHYYEQFIIPNQHRITLLQSSNPLIIDEILSSNSILSKLNRLQNLILYNIKSKYFEELFSDLISLPCLSSLIINCADIIKNKNDFYQQIFRLPTLKYLKLSLKEDDEYNSLPIATTEFSPIENLILTGRIYINELNTLLSYIPKIQRLTIHNLYKSIKQETNELHSIMLKYLKYVSLNIIDVTFKEFELIIKNFFYQIEILYIKIKDNQEYIDANRWQELINSYLLNLQIFDIQYKYSFNNNNDLFNKFNSLFWFERKWFFEHHFYYNQNSFHGVFFSTNPYRRKKYVLCDESNKITNQDIINSINHIKIQTKKAMMICQNSFPNVTEINFSDDFIHEIKTSFSTQLGKIISLKLLTKFIIKLNISCFSKMIELLRYTPNIHTFNIELLPYNQSQKNYHWINFYTLHQNKTFELVSKTNKIKNLIMKSCNDIIYVQFFIDLFPRLKHITSDTFISSMSEFLKLLLLKPSNNTRHLTLLCVENVPEYDITRIEKLINSQNEIKIDFMKIRNCSSNDINIKYKVYFWW